MQKEQLSYNPSLNEGSFSMSFEEFKRYITDKPYFACGLEFAYANLQQYLLGDSQNKEKSLSWWKFIHLFPNLMVREHKK